MNRATLCIASTLTTLLMAGCTQLPQSVETAGEESAGTGTSNTSADNGDPNVGAAAGGGTTSGTNNTGGSTPAGSSGLTIPQIFPPDNPWNTDISNYPVHPNSANYINSIGRDRALHPDFGTFWEGAPIGIPFVLVAGDQPRVPVSFEYEDESDPGPYPIPPDAPIEGGSTSSGDRHVVVIDADNRKLYELFAAYPIDGGARWGAGSGAIFDLTSNALRPMFWTSADAAGLPIFPGLVRYDEVVERGEITHAIRFTVQRTQRAFIPPATHFASSSTDPSLPPMGLRFRLKADFDETGYSPNVVVILRAMKKYGLIVADNGSNWYVTGTHDPRWNDEELGELKRLRGSDFEAVYTGDAITD